MDRLIVERLPRDQEQFTVECVEKPDITSVPEHGGGLSHCLAGWLGNEYLSGKPAFGKLEGDQRPERDADPIGETHGRSGHNPKQGRVICRAAGGSENGRQRHAVGTSQLLEESSDRIDHAAPAIRECLQAEQVIRQQKLERAEQKK
ncbi:hypothetical protein [Xenorhabdus miraniensis]|uniref:Uncharacterized protein n=1 Tax=Xenorhabdus miraniensis TaxID=351674 RepID=A0A2D0JKV7_9GAMM|nr:hypothetical protein [Xenorhabdus miraniensis]PHM46917.1 hypothetical protein Xmir_03796 [Xenorhabdus miraniensis]